MFKRVAVLSTFLLCATLAYAQPDALTPTRIQKAAQELSVYMRAGEVCGIRNHHGAAQYLAFLIAMNKDATDLGFGGGSLMVDGMVAR